MIDDAARETEPTSGPGPMLRRARELRGLTEQQAAEQLNLDVSVVDALERDDLAALGAPVFAKGHLRRYGALLGLAEDSLLAAYRRAQAQPETPSLVPRSRLEMMPVRGKPKWPWVLGGALAFVLAAIVAAVVSEYGLRWPGWSEPDAVVAQGTLPEAGAPGSVLTAPAGTPGEPQAAAAGLAAGTRSPTVGPPLPVPPGHVSVSLAFAADSWAEIYDGSGKAVLYDLGRAGSQRAIAAAAPLSISLGNPRAVTLAVNGRPTALPAPPAGQTVARFRIEADGRLR